MEDSDIDAPIRDSIMAQRAFNCNKKEECYNLIKVLSKSWHYDVCEYFCVALVQFGSISLLDFLTVNHD